MFLKILILILFFAVMIGVGIYCRKTANNVQGFVLGEDSYWVTARWVHGLQHSLSVHLTFRP